MAGHAGLDETAVPGLSPEMKEIKPLKGRDLLAAGLVLLNVLVLTPCAWIAGHLWDENRTFQKATENELRKLRSDLTDLQIHTAMYFVLKEIFHEHCNRINDRLTKIGQ